MTNPVPAIYRFFKVVVSGQAYINLIYLLAAFPLGVFYFVFLVSGLSLGISLSIIWVGIPLLLVVGSGWWALARFERFMAAHCLGESILAIKPRQPASREPWGQIKSYLANPFTWKSPVYLLLKFPLGVATFSILVILIAMTLAALTLPLTYAHMDVQIAGFFSPDGPSWQVNNLGQASVGTLVGLLLWPLTMQVSNGLAWVHAKFARLMLCMEPIS